MIRPATQGDAEACAALLLEPPGGFREIAGDEIAALRMAHAAFLARGSAMSFERTLVHEGSGGVDGQVVRFDTSEWANRRVRSGLAMLRVAGPLAALRLVWRGPIEEALMPPLPERALYVLSLAVSPSRRSAGVGARLLEAVISEASRAGLRQVALDVAVSNERAIRFYLRQGFRSEGEIHLPPRRGLPAMGSVRMAREL